MKKPLLVKRIFYFAPAITYYGLIFYFSSKPSEITVEIPDLDMVLHCLEFVILGFFLSLGYFKSFGFSIKSKAFIVLFNGIILGILDEIHQYYVPGRESEVTDAIADGAGILIGVLIYLYLQNKVKEKSKI